MTIAQRIETVNTAIEHAKQRYGREDDAIICLAVSKMRKPDEVRQAHAAGIRDFGENYLQEALPKIELLADLNLTWHFIGSIQSNKTRQIAKHFAWVHTIARLDIMLTVLRGTTGTRRPLPNGP